MVRNLPINYIFFLKCCYATDCPHPFCQRGAPNEPLRWFPEGPEITFLPFPTPDPSRPYGGECEKCKPDTCAGHYLHPGKLLAHHETGKQISLPVPPSQIIKSAFEETSGENIDLLAVAQETLLPLNEVELWVDHLKQVRENRRQGARKAARTRRKKKLLPTVTEQQLTEEQNVEDIYGHICACCSEEEPPYAGKAKESVSWIECDTCGMWQPLECLEVDDVPDGNWFCSDSCQKLDDLA